MTDPGFAAFNDPALDAAAASQGPLPTDVASRLIARAQAKLDAGEAALSTLDFRRVVGHADPAITGAALVGLGDAVYRLDDEGQAKAAWEAATRLRDNPSTYRAWRNLAGVLVREGDLQAAINAYREADRRAPSEDKAEIASRLGWLAKETGNSGAAGRYFARSRGTAGVGLTQVLVIFTSIVSLIALSDPIFHLDPANVTDEQLMRSLFYHLALVPDAIRHGELWRLVTVALVHAQGPSLPQLSLHLLLNMYALWIIGPIVEGAWGRRLLLVFYALCAIGGSTASFVFSNTVAVGASGAIFGLVGVVLAGTRAHHPMLDRRARAIVPQLGMFVIINLVFGFAVTGAGGNIDNAAHIGGLLAGVWLGILVPPGKVPTLRSAWQNPRGAAAERSPLLLAAGVLLLLGVISIGLAIGGATL
ncbi:MAG TPA: rhomboid family intramembrane serine protease [Candidatus Limnocylindrales bacterium]|nr:rhomboid family intramembrane serine protease [Candidatus Limnocylindrales bacterium]